MNSEKNQSCRLSVWRIEEIPFEKKAESSLVNFLPALGALGFMLGFAMIFLAAVFHVKSVAQFYELALKWTPVCLAFMFASFWWVARQKRSGWIIVEGRCLDREFKEINGTDGKTWAYRILCEYEYAGNSYRVIPAVGWSTYTTEANAKKYLDERVSPDGKCRLAFNPKVPLETELLGNLGIKELLFWKAYSGQ